MSANRIYYDDDKCKAKLEYDVSVNIADMSSEIKDIVNEKLIDCINDIKWEGECQDASPKQNTNDNNVCGVLNSQFFTLEGLLKDGYITEDMYDQHCDKMYAIMEGMNK